MQRGGRGGRGRGRFGGRGSVAQDLIRDNLEDLGIDSYHNNESRVAPPLYPVIEIPIPNELSAKDKYLVDISLQITKRFKESSFYLQRDNQSEDESIYSINNAKQKKKVSVKHVLRECYDDITKYIPSELLDESFASLKASSKKRKDDIAFMDLEKAENGGVTRETSLNKDKDANSDTAEEAELEEEEIEFEEDDYGVDHYASDGEIDDDDEDKEATF